MKKITMRIFDYIKTPEKLLTPEIVRWLQVFTNTKESRTTQPLRTGYIAGKYVSMEMLIEKTKDYGSGGTDATHLKDCINYDIIVRRGAK